MHLVFSLHSLHSLALHPSGRLLASCSSGDGLVKFWDCGRAAQASSSQLMASADEFVERVASEDDETTPETSDDSLVTTEVERTPEGDSMDVDTFAGRSLPSRSLSSYSVRQPQDSLETKQSCRVSPHDSRFIDYLHFSLLASCMDRRRQQCGYTGR